MPMFDPYAGGGSTPNWSGFDPKRVQTRISYLQKVRPKDASIGKFQGLLKQYNDYMADQGQGGNQGSGGTTTTGSGTDYGFYTNNPFGQSATDAYNQYSDWSKNNQPNFDNVAKLPGADDFAAERQRIEGELYGRAQGDLDKRYKTLSDEFEQTMANQGVDIGSERYKQEKELFLRGRDQAYSDARFDALKNAGAEQSRLFGDAMSARQQGVDEATSLRTQRLADLAAMINPSLNLAQLGSQQESEKRRIDAERELQERDQSFRSRENRKDRSIKLREIAKIGSGGGGGGGGALDINKILEIVEKLTGQRLGG